MMVMQNIVFKRVSQTAAPLDVGFHSHDHEVCLGLIFKIIREMSESELRIDEESSMFIFHKVN